MKFQQTEMFVAFYYLVLFSYQLLFKKFEELFYE